MLNSDNYYQDTSYFSFSMYKKFMKCEAAAMAEIQGIYSPATSPALLIGSYVDAVLCGEPGELDKFITDHPEVISSRGATKGELKAEFKHADVMIERCRRDDVFMSFLQGNYQVILTGSIGGVPVKGKLDVLAKDKIVDFKSAKDFELVWTSDGKVTFIESWGYDYQAAFYQELVRQKTKRKLPYYIAAVTKEPVPDIAVIHIPDKVIDLRLQEIEHFLPELQIVAQGLVGPQRCEKCDWCKDTKILAGAITLDQLREEWE